MKNNILHKHFADKTYMVKILIPNYFLIGQSAHTPVIFILENFSSIHQYNQETYYHRTI